MKAFLWNLWSYGLWWIAILANGFFLYQICRPFVVFRKAWHWRVLLYLTLAGSSGMVIWVGDPNLLYTFPVYFLLFLLCTKGNLTGRLAVCIIIFCLEMSVCALLDTYVQEPDINRMHDLLVRLLRTAIFGILWLLLRRRFPTEQVRLSRRLWQLVLGLAVMPLCALIAVVLLTFQKYESAAVNALALNQGLQQQESQVRQLRHDLRNHLTVIQGLLEKGDTQEAVGYLEQMGSSPALRGSKRFCDNDVANVVLSAKAEAMEQAGITADFAVSIPKDLPVADTDLAALLGNALDNAIEGVQNAAGKKITLRCRVDKGLLMLRLENPVSREVNPDLSTTKADNFSHGFGLPSMREIAERYGGTLSAGVKDGKFELVVCFPG